VTEKKVDAQATKEEVELYTGEVGEVTVAVTVKNVSADTAVIVKSEVYVKEKIVVGTEVRDLQEVTNAVVLENPSQ
jgi:hypothetical protein